MFTCVVQRHAPFAVLLVPRPFGGRHSGQMQGVKEHPSSGITKYNDNIHEICINPDPLTRKQSSTRGPKLRYKLHPSVKRQ